MYYFRLRYPEKKSIQYPLNLLFINDNYLNYVCNHPFL
jgi:hypothetical protein